MADELLNYADDAVITPLLRIQAEAETMGALFPPLLAADLVRFRRLAEAAVPPMTEWQWGLLSHLLSDFEFNNTIMGSSELPGRNALAAEIDEWADSAQYDDIERAGELRQQITAWTPLTIAGVLFRLRPETVSPTSAKSQGCSD